MDPKRATIINPNVDIDDYLDEDDFPYQDDDEDFDDIGSPDYIPDEDQFIR